MVDLFVHSCWQSAHTKYCDEAIVVREAVGQAQLVAMFITLYNTWQLHSWGGGGGL